MTHNEMLVQNMVATSVLLDVIYLVTSARGTPTTND